MFIVTRYKWCRHLKQQGSFFSSNYRGIHFTSVFTSTLLWFLWICLLMIHWILRLSTSCAKRASRLKKINNNNNNNIPDKTTIMETKATAVFRGRVIVSSLLKQTKTETCLDIVALRGHNWQHFAHRPLCIVTLNSIFAIFKTWKMFSIRVKELYEPIVLWKKGDGLWLFL